MYRSAGSSASRPAVSDLFAEMKDRLLGGPDVEHAANANGNGERRVPVLYTNANPAPPGGLTKSTPGLTDRVKRALASARATTASTVINGEATGAHLTFERDLDGWKQEG
jgi:hypothetical protein